MSTTSSLFDRFISFNNFKTAFIRVAGKNSKGGIDRMSVDDFDKKLEKNIRKLIDTIIEGRYAPEPVISVHIPKFNAANEWRELGLPTVSDKVVQTALLQVAEPLSEKKFLSNSYGYRPGKGPYKALRRVEHAITNEKCCWVVSHDIDNFFGTLNHQRLLALWEDLVTGDSRLVEIVALWCKMGIIGRDGHWQNVMNGVRQGQVIAPLLANLYLHDLDKYITDQGWGYVRYADDFLLLCKNRQEAQNSESAVRNFLYSIQLELNDSNPKINSLENGFTFLGVTFKGDNRSISLEKIMKMTAKLRWLFNSSIGLRIDALFIKLNAMLEGWVRYYSFLKPVDAFAGLNKEIETGLLEWLRRQKGNQKQYHGMDYPLLPVSFTSYRACLQKMKVSGLTAKYSIVISPIQKNPSVEKKIKQKKRNHQSREVMTNELFVNTPGSFIGKRGNRVIVRVKQSILAEIPVIRLKKIVVAGGGVGLSSDVIRLCADENINISFIDGIGITYSMAVPPAGATVDLVLLQIQHRESEKGYHLACMFVLGKMKNQFALLKSYMKYKDRGLGVFGREFSARRREMEALIEDVKQLKSRMDGIKTNFRQVLMGIEGRFASHYWQLIRVLLPSNVRIQIV